MKDHCILLSNHISDREKMIKRKFLTAKNVQPEKKETKEDPIERNFTQDEKVAFTKLFQAQRTEVPSPVQMNAVFSQNKLLERNVEILHETQKSLQTMMVYNMSKEKEETKSEKTDNSLAIIKELIAPLYQSINQINNNFQDILLRTSNPVEKSNSINNQQLESKLNELIRTKSNVVQAEKQVSASKEKNPKNDVYLNGFNELNGKLENFNSDIQLMNKRIEEQFNDLKKENNKRKLLDGGAPNKGVKRRNSFDYEEFKNELLEIESEKKRILQEFEEKSLPDRTIRRFKKGDKIEFNFRLVDDNENKELVQVIPLETKNKSTKSNYFVKENNQRQTNERKKTEKSVKNQTKTEAQTKTDFRFKEKRDNRTENLWIETNNERKEQRVETDTKKTTTTNFINTRKIQNLDEGREKENILKKSEMTQKKVEAFLKETKKEENAVEKVFKEAFEESAIKTINKRREVVAIENTESEKGQQVLLHDLITKLCLDKLLPPVGKDNKQSYQSNIPFKYNEDRVKEMTVELIMNKLRNKERRVKEEEVSKEQQLSELSVVKDTTLIKKLEAEVNLQNAELVKMIEGLSSKIGDMSKSTSSQLNLEELVKLINPQREINITVKVERDAAEQPERKVEQPVEDKGTEVIKVQTPFIMTNIDNFEVAGEEKFAESHYSHPFETNEHYESYSEDVPVNYSIDFQGYLISATSEVESYREKSLSKFVNKSSEVSISEGEAIDNSLSEGEIPMLKNKMKAEELLERMIEQTSKAAETQRRNVSEMLSDKEELKKLGIYLSDEFSKFAQGVKGQSETSKLGFSNLLSSNRNAPSFRTKSRVSDEEIRMPEVNEEELILLKEKQKILTQKMRMISTISEDSHEQEINTIDV